MTKLEEKANPAIKKLISKDEDQLYKELGMRQKVIAKDPYLMAGFDFDAKYKGQVEEITPARISSELTKRVQKLTSAIYDILGCKGIIRIDYIITEGDMINLLEVNTTPGMTTTSFIPQQVRAAGLQMKDVLTDIIENELDKRK